jgi:phosphoribosylglycinamide formyltransferase-1
MNVKRIAVLASGRGSNFKAILEKINEGVIPAVVGLCVTNNRNAGVIEIAESHDIPVSVISPKDYPDQNLFNDAILKALTEEKIEYLVLAGYLKLLGKQIVGRYNNKIINIHPALLPSFGGKGMYGHHVHDAVFNRGVKISGATVHLVNNEFDAGPIVMQKTISIGDVKNADEIATRVLEIEHEIFPMSVKLLVEERLIVKGLRVEIKGETVAGD